MEVLRIRPHARADEHAIPFLRAQMLEHLRLRGLAEIDEALIEIVPELANALPLGANSRHHFVGGDLLRDHFRRGEIEQRRIEPNDENALRHPATIAIAATLAN